MGLKYVINSIKRRVLRTIIIALALTIGVALVGALLALVDTQRQFSLQMLGTASGGYDLSVNKNNLAKTIFFDIGDVTQVISKSYDKVAQVYPRIQSSVEGRKTGAVDGQAVTLVALNTDNDKLVSVTSGNARNNSGIGGINIRIGGGGRGPGSGGGPPGGGRGPGGGGPPDAVGGGQSNTGNNNLRSRNLASNGVYPPQLGQVYLDTSTAGVLGVKVGDDITLAYAIPIQRQEGQAAVTGVSVPRITAKFTVSGIGVLDGLSSDVSNPLIMLLEDAQAWLNQPGQSNQLLVVWRSSNSTTDAKATVSNARAVAAVTRNALQASLGPEFDVGLPKYTALESNAQSYAFSQTFITLYGILSMGIVGLMVNALMNTTVAEMKHDLAVLRVLGSPRARLYEAVIIEVAMLGAVGIVLGLLLGRAINDYLMVPTILANLDLPAGVRADWTLQTVLIPTAITIVVLTVATISPARAAAATKVMVVLNPAAADQPTLDDLAKLRERRADGGLLIAGLVLLGFSAVILIVQPLVFTPGNQSSAVALQFGALLLMVIGISLLFYFVTTPLERVLIKLYQFINPMAAYFAGRYALRGKGRNALISLMVVMSGVLPCLLSTQLALQNANVETDRRFANGAPIVATTRSASTGGNDFPFFRRSTRTDTTLSANDIAALKDQPGIDLVVGVADNLPNMTVSDPIGLRNATVSLVGVEGDLTKVLYSNLFRWINSNSSALTQITQDENAAIISQGLSESLDLKVGDTIKIKGTGNDHIRLLRIVGVAARVPGFNNTFTRNSSDANRSAILMNLETYRDLNHDPAIGVIDTKANLVTKLLATVQTGVNETTLLQSLRDYLGNKNDMTVTATSESVTQARAQLQQSRIFIVLLTGLSMVTAIFGVLAVMYTAVMGRRVEIGMLKAVGASKGALRGVFIGEALITTLAAGIAGIVAGTILGYAFEASQRLQNDRVILLAFDFNTAGLIIAMVSLAAIFSSVLATQPVVKQKAIKILRER